MQLIIREKEEGGGGGGGRGGGGLGFGVNGGKTNVFVKKFSSQL